MSYALSYEMSFRLSFPVSFPTSFLRSFPASFDRSFELRVSSSHLAVCSGGADPNLSNLRHLRNLEAVRAAERDPSIGGARRTLSASLKAGSGTSGMTKLLTPTLSSGRRGRVARRSRSSGEGHDPARKQGTVRARGYCWGSPLSMLSSGCWSRRRSALKLLKFQVRPSAKVGALVRRKRKCV
jgi:hypothetical protein